MGGSKSSKTTTNQTRNESTTTTAVEGQAFSFSGSGETNIGDVGLTGKAAVALSTNLGQQSIETQRLNLLALDRVANQASSAFDQSLSFAERALGQVGSIASGGFRASPNPVFSSQASILSDDRIIKVAAVGGAVIAAVVLLRK